MINKHTYKTWSLICMHRVHVTVDRWSSMYKFVWCELSVQVCDAPNYTVQWCFPITKVLMHNATGNFRLTFYSWKSINFIYSHFIVQSLAYAIIVIIHTCLSVTFASWLFVLQHAKYTRALIIHSFIMSLFRLTVNCAYFFYELLSNLYSWVLLSKLLFLKNSLRTILSKNAFITQQQRCLLLVHFQKFQTETYSNRY